MRVRVSGVRAVSVQQSLCSAHAVRMRRVHAACACRARAEAGAEAAAEAHHAGRRDEPPVEHGHVEVVGTRGACHPRVHRAAGCRVQGAGCRVKGEG